MNTIQQQWETFAKAVMPPNASPVQVREMRRAFYGGCEAMMRIQWNVADMSEEAGIAVLQGCHEEVEQFALTVLRGKA